MGRQFSGFLSAAAHTATAGALIDLACFDSERSAIGPPLQHDMPASRLFSIPSGVTPCSRLLNHQPY